ncbi:MAG: THUMP domain-containing protein [Candidatus Helarchaeota archaeon]
MSFRFNILVSTPRNFEKDALAELDFLIHQIFPEKKFNYGRTIVNGLIWGNLTEEVPTVIVKKIKEKVQQQHFDLQYLLKFVPIQEVIHTDINKIEEYLTSNIDLIKPEEKFKIVIKKRRFNLSSSEIIEVVAKNIDRTVDLDNPDKIIRIEIIGKYTGISILSPDDVFSLKRKLF